jgi:hypothetical protein
MSTFTPYTGWEEDLYRLAQEVAEHHDGPTPPFTEFGLGRLMCRVIAAFEPYRMGLRRLQAPGGTTINRCTARIRPLTDDTEIQCEVSTVDAHGSHAGVLRDYAYPGSATVISWREDDRRIFRGEWTPCPVRSAGVAPVCILPAEHHGEHEY